MLTKMQKMKERMKNQQKRNRFLFDQINLQLKRENSEQRIFDDRMPYCRGFEFDSLENEQNKRLKVKKLGNIERFYL